MRSCIRSVSGFGFGEAAASVWAFFCAASLWGIGDLGKGELILELGVASEYDSNVFLSDSEIDDFMTKANMEMAFEQESSSLMNLRARAGVEAVRFAELLDENADNYDADFDYSYPNNVDRNFYYSMGGSWSRKTRSRKELGKRLESDRSNARASFETDISPKTGLRFSGWRETERFSDETLFGSDDFSSDLDYLHRYSSKLNIIGGYRYHQLEYIGEGQLKQIGHYLRFAGEGQLSPKVDGVLSVGMQYLSTRIDPTEKRSGLHFFYEMELNWQASDKVAIGLSGESDFFNSPTGEINNHRDLSIDFKKALTVRTSGSASLTLIEDDYEGRSVPNGVARKDRAYRFDVNYFFDLTRNSSLGASLQYEHRNSSLSRFDYDHLRFGIDFFIMF